MTGGPDGGVYDVLVIGAGIGGLTAAALAAHDGARVLTLETHNRPGGCAGDFALGGLLFPAGATLLSGFERGGLHDLVYRTLGIRHRAVALERAMQVVTPTARFNFWTDRARWDAEWRTAFPGNEQGKAAFFHWADQLGGVVHRLASRLPVLPPRAPRDLLRLATAFRPEVLRGVPFIPRTIAGVMAAHGADRDRRFRQFIDAQLLDATGCLAGDCAAINGAIALDLYHRGCFALPGGAAEIARDLARALRRDGGDLRYGATVTRIRRDAHGWWQVQTAAGGTYVARRVIANVPAWDLPALLDGAPRRPAQAARALGDRAWGAVVLHAAVDPSVLPPEPYAYAQVLPAPDAPLSEGNMCFITVLPSSRRPGAARAVSVSTHTAAGPWWQGDDAHHQERRAEYTERLLAACEAAFPGFRTGVRWVRTATPRTYQRYTHRGGGLVGGVRMDRRHTLLGSVSHRSGMPGLYLCGDTVFPGQGTIGVTLSGINAWRSTRDDLGRLHHRSGRAQRAHPAEHQRRSA